MNAGGLLVVAAANDNTYHRNSTNHPGIIVVAATDQNDAKATFSNWGSFIDISAPGVAIHTTSLTTNINGMYGAASGTSFSSPMVAAVAALIWARNPALSPASVRDILFRTARDLGTAGYDETFGHGRVDAGAALAMAAVATEPVAPPTPPSPGRGGGKKK
jgi:subtilisin family serine protease